MAPSIPATMAPGVETATSIPQAWPNIHSFRRSLIRATTRGTPNSTFASRPRTRLALSSPVAAITTSHVCLLQRGQLASVGVEPVGSGNRVGFEVAAFAFDQQDLVPGIQQLLRYRPPDLARAGDRDPQLSGLHPSHLVVSAAKRGGHVALSTEGSDKGSEKGSEKSERARY